MNNPRVAVIMAGGSGERFWPLSRPDRPKQLLRLTHPTLTMLEEAESRIRPLVGDHVFVSTSQSLYGVISEASVVPPSNVFAEPARRNTLGALIWVVASLVARGFSDATVAVLTADHMIGETDRFLSTVSDALEIAEETNGLVTLGITPTRPETGYGYIQVDRENMVCSAQDRIAFRSRRFLEKPSVNTAIEFMASGDHLWNSGMFFFTVAAFRSELEGASPEASQILEDVIQALLREDLVGATRSFELLPNLSIDFALMEKAREVYVIPSDFPWDDVGAWDALERSRTTNEEGNVIEGHVVALESSGCVIVNEDGHRIVGVLGLVDLVVVATHDAILVCPKSEAQGVRKIAEAARKSLRDRKDAS